MNIREISLQEFENFALNNMLGNYYQTLEYALLKGEEGYDYEFIGYGSNDDLLAASLILYKKIGNYFYGYAPRGFLIDYSNKVLLKNFTEQLIQYYKNKKFAFIKINPEIAIGLLNKNTMNIEYNINYEIVNTLISNGYKKLKNNMYFESLLPRVNAILPLNTFNLNSVSKNTRNKIKKGIRKGLLLEKKDLTDIDTLYNFLKNKGDITENKIKDLYNVFKKKEAVDLLLVKIDYKSYLINSQEKYEKELIRNNKLNEKIVYKSTSKNINSKMNSDKALLSYKSDITEASNHLNEKNDVYIAGALVIKYQNRIVIKWSGFDQNYKRFAPNYFLYYAILEYYKKNYDYADLFGVTADLTNNSPYHGLNRFKLGFNPLIYEYIGEFDLIIMDHAYESLLNTNLLAKEFNKK